MEMSDREPVSAAVSLPALGILFPAVWTAAIAGIAMTAQVVLVWGWTDEICMGWPPDETFVRNPAAWHCDVDLVAVLLAAAMFSVGALPFAVAVSWLLARLRVPERLVSRGGVAMIAVGLALLAVCAAVASPLLLVALSMLYGVFGEGAYPVLGGLAVFLFLAARRDLRAWV